MALTTCIECQGKVSTLAAACPHCGAPVSGGDAIPVSIPSPPDPVAIAAVEPLVKPHSDALGTERSQRLIPEPELILTTNSSSSDKPQTPARVPISTAANSLPVENPTMNSNPKSKPILALFVGALAYFIVVKVCLVLFYLLNENVLGDKNPNFKWALFLCIASGAIAISVAGKLSAWISPNFHRMSLAALSFGTQLTLALIGLAIFPNPTPNEFGNELLILIGTGAGVCMLGDLNHASKKPVAVDLKIE